MYKLSRLCPSNITAVTPISRATQPGSDEIGDGPAVSDSKVYAINQMPDALNVPSPLPLLTLCDLEEEKQTQIK